jgi:hypothetical protein
MKKLLDTADGDMIHYTPMEKKSDKIFIGIDPGKDGALAVLWPEFPKPPADESPTAIPFDRDRFICELSSVKSLMNTGHCVRCVLEHVGAMPGQGSVSMFNFGQNFGWIQGVLDAHRIPYELVRPQKWKKVFSCTSDKNTSVEVARRLFPHIDLRRTPKCTKPHDGICEALLMAEYARRVLG